jgi:hypothetical protein|tara:strand:+ start:383 stop:793 length:411 start_codon:yes stop_codon:yes gene_type:complete
MIKFTKENVEFLEQVDLIVKRFTETKENKNLIHLFILNIEQLYILSGGESKIIKMWERINHFVDEFLPKWQESALAELDEELLQIELIKYETYENETKLYDIVYSKRMNTDLTRDFREKYIKEIKQWATKTLKKEE